MSIINTDEHLIEHPQLNLNAYVKLTRLSKEDIERNTSKNHKKEITSNLSNVCIPPRTLKQEYQVNANINIYETSIKHTSWQSSVQEFGTNVKIEAANLVEVKIEPKNRIKTITQSTTFLNYKENKFICKICYVKFENVEEYLVHKNFLHKSTPYVCKVCNAKFVLSAHLNLHLAEHVNYLCIRNSSLNPSEIQSSSKSTLTINPSGNFKNSRSMTTLAIKSSNTNTSENVQQNASNNSIENLCVTDPNITLQKTKCKSFKCLNCMFATESKTKFLDHHDICNNISKNTPKLHQCHLCVKSFKNHLALNGHLKYHSYKSEVISKKQLTINIKKVKNQNKKSSVVKSQKYVFPKIANFNRSHKCKDCNRNFTTRRKLNIHYKQHKPQIICNMCNKKFVFKKNFEKHLLSHTNVIISNGIANDTSFNKMSMGDKSETRKISNKEKTIYYCSYCNNYFKSKQSLSQHNRQHHSIIKTPNRKPKSKTVKCNWCNLVITKCNLLRHIKSLHPKVNPIKCPYCPMSFKVAPSLKLHISECHTL